MHILADLDAWSNTDRERLWQLSIDAGPATDGLDTRVCVGELCVRVTVRASGAAWVAVSRGDETQVEVWRTDGTEHGS